MAPQNQRVVLLKHGVRSGLEKSNAIHLRHNGVPYKYESGAIPYTPPLQTHKYTPDFVLITNGIVVETKGRWLTADRKKIRTVREQHPDIDLRMVFSNSRQKISKQSVLTYGGFCEKLGILYADRLIPKAWLAEPFNRKSITALKKLGLL